VTLTEVACESYFQALAEVDPRRASELVIGLLDEGISQQQITAEVIAPSQVRVGQMWEQGRWTVADEHAATAVTETALAALTAATATPPSSPVHVVIACAEGEWHTLPARMVAGSAGSSGVRVTVLGPSLPAAHLAQRLDVGDVDLLALSCTMPTNLLGAARSIAAAHDAGVPVIAGGRAFGPGPDRAHALGADAWATDAGSLLGPVPPLRGARFTVPTEALLLDAVSDQSIELAYERVTASFSGESPLASHGQTCTREDLRSMARFTGAAILTGDDTVLAEYLDWLALLLAPKVPLRVLTAAVQTMAETVEPDAPTGARLLRRAAARLASGAT
jgi:methanogenic corrinoid protein MtbC1